MTSITLTVTGAIARASVNGSLTSGMVGIPVTIEYDDAWKGLTKNLVCRCGKWGPEEGKTRTVLNVGEAATVAHEVMKAGMYLYLGIEGYSADGKLVIPTTWADCGKIQYGANAGADPSTNPKLPFWAQLQTEIRQLSQRAATKEMIDDGIKSYLDRNPIADLGALTLGIHTDGLVYIFLGGKPIGNGLDISGGSIVEPVYGDPVVDNAVLSITKGQTVQLGIMLSEEPTQKQTITVLSDSDALTFDKTKLTFQPSNWNVMQFVGVTAGDISEDTTATITLRNSDELLTDTAITVYLTADAYSVDTTIPDGAHTVTIDDFDSYTASGTDKVILVGYKAEYDNIYIPATLTVEGAEKTPILRDTTFASNTTIKYVDIDSAVYLSQSGHAKKELIHTFKECTSLIGVKYRGTDITSLHNAFNGCTSLKFVDGLELQTAVQTATYAFMGCTSLEYIPDLSNWTVCTNAEQMFNGCSALKKVYGVPPAITSAKMFYYKCTALESAEIPSSVTTATFCFDGCTALEKVYIYAEELATAASMFANCNGTKVYVPEGSTTYTTLSGIYGSSASIELLYLGGGGGAPVVSCWGDSTTSTGTDGEAWPTRLQNKLGDSMQVKNMAISGEYSTSTACRQGGNGASLASGVKIPAKTEAVAVTLKSKDGQTFGTSPVLSTGANYNPVTIAGIEGTVSVTSGQAYFTRRNAGNETAVPAGIAVVSKNAVARKADAVQIIYLGTNSGWNLNPNTLLNQVQSMVDYYGGSNYIIMGPAGGQMVRTEAARATVFEYESMAAAAFGDHWLNLREYLIANSLSENGLTATAKDTERMADGLIPWSILLGSNTEGGTDDVHYNTHGLQSVCNAVYAKGQELGYWE